MRDRLPLAVRFLTVTVVALVVALGVRASAQTPDAKRDNEKMEQTLSVIMTRASAPIVKGKTPPPLRTTRARK